MTGRRLGGALTLSGIVLWSITGTVAAQIGTREVFPGVPNFWRIDATAANGGAIDSPDLAIPELKRRGFRAVVNVAGGPRAEAEGAAVQAAGMKYFLIPVNAKALEAGPADTFLQVVRDPANQPVFLHSGQGHRTAMLWMIKRVLVDGWCVERAGAEATTIGLINNNAFVPGYWQFAREYITAHSK